MARIRSIRPEFWTRRKLAPASPVVRLVMVGLIQHADDEGRLEAEPVILCSQLFAAGGVSLTDFEAALDYLADAGEIVRYWADDAPYICMPGWCDRNSWQFQHISKPTASRLPEPPDDGAEDPVTEDSASPPGALQEDSGSAPAWNREQGTGSLEQGRGNRESPPIPSPGGEGEEASASLSEENPESHTLTAGQRAVAMVIAEAIANNHVRLEGDEDRQRCDQELGAANAALRDAKQARDGNAVAAAERGIREIERQRSAAEKARRAEIVALLRGGDPSCLPVLERWQNSDVLCGKEKHRVPLRVACKVARDQARGDDRDSRRGSKSKRRGGKARVA